MIHVSDLVKSYGPVRALDRVSFDVGEREVLGFLGPNGAGKSTTLRILTGFLSADAGSVTVAGHDIRLDSLAARASIGYLPEGVPLYPEMRVGEYLRFRSRLKRIRRPERRAVISKALEQTGVEDVERRIIGTLSRGYRQRVGLADALLGSPPILILDEPTVGLDPEQVRQFRDLLKELGRTRTVILSTHILSEAEQVAGRIAIIVRGRIAAQDTTENLRRRVGALDRIRVELAPAAAAPAGSEEMARELRQIPGVDRVRLEDLEESEGAAGPGNVGNSGNVGKGGGPGFHRFIIRPPRGGDPRVEIAALAARKGWALRELSRLPMSLEDIFLEIISEGGGGRPAGKEGA